MIDTKLLHLNYIRKEPQTGSFCGMRYMLRKGTSGEQDCIDAFCWPEPFCFIKTPEEQKKLRQFPLTQEGLENAVNWLNEQYESVFSHGLRPDRS